MSILSTIFAVFMLAACGSCITRRDHYGIGLAMFLSLIFYIQPVRELIPFGQSSIYVVLIDLFAAMIIMALSGNTVTGRLLLVSLAMLIFFGHVPFMLGKIEVYTFDYIANIIGWLQILTITGGIYGNKIGVHLCSFNIRYRPLYSTLGSRWQNAAVYNSKTLKARVLFNSKIVKKNNING